MIQAGRRVCLGIRRTIADLELDDAAETVRRPDENVETTGTYPDLLEDGDSPAEFRAQEQSKEILTPPFGTRSPRELGTSRFPEASAEVRRDLDREISHGSDDFISRRRKIEMTIDFRKQRASASKRSLPHIGHDGVHRIRSVDEGKTVGEGAHSLV